MFWKQTSILCKLLAVISVSWAFIDIIVCELLYCCEDQLICQQMRQLFCYLLLAWLACLGPAQYCQCCQQSHTSHTFTILTLSTNTQPCKPIHKMSSFEKSFLTVWVILLLHWNGKKKLTFFLLSQTLLNMKVFLP